MRARRRALEPVTRLDAAVAASAHATSLEALVHARHLATYLPVDGELDPTLIVRDAWARGVAVYVPFVGPGAPAALGFARFTVDTELVTGRYGITVPAGPTPDIDPAALDAVLVPLVAFDARMTRAGSGAGYYDRTFAARQRSAAPPLLVGLAYAWQQVEVLRREPWDVPLDVVVTEQGIVRADQPR